MESSIVGNHRHYTMESSVVELRLSWVELEEVGHWAYSFENLSFSQAFYSLLGSLCFKAIM